MVPPINTGLRAQEGASNAGPSPGIPSALGRCFDYRNWFTKKTNWLRKKERRRQLRTPIDFVCVDCNPLPNVDVGLRRRAIVVWKSRPAKLRRRVFFSSSNMTSTAFSSCGSRPFRISAGSSYGQNIRSASNCRTLPLWIVA